MCDILRLKTFYFIFLVLETGPVDIFCYDCYDWDVIYTYICF